MYKILMLLTVFLAFSTSLLANTLPVITSKPVIDGHLDKSLQPINLNTFSKIYTFNNEFTEQNISANYLLALHQQGLYVFIQTDADRVRFHKRGYLYGDGFKLLIGKVTPFGMSKEYLEFAFSPTNLKEDKEFESYVSSYNGNNQHRVISNQVTLTASQLKNGTGFETFIPWQFLHPYHPASHKNLGINLYFAKGMENKSGQHVTKGFAIKADEGLWDESIEHRNLKAFNFERGAIFSEVFDGSFYFENNAVIQGQPLSGTIQSTTTKNHKKTFEISDDNYEVISTFADIPVNSGNFTLATTSLPIGTYKVTLQSTEIHHTQRVTILPEIKIQSLVDELAHLNLRASEEATLAFKINELRSRIISLKSYETAESIEKDYSEIKILLKKRAHGEQFNTVPNKTYRRAFYSLLDGQIQPYSIRLPKGYNPNIKYPLLVFLHGSGQDEQHLLQRERSNGKFIEIAPLGRDIYNAYAYQHSNIDIEEAIQDALKHYSIDENNMIIGGFSMGGYGALKVFYENPHRYKAVAVFAGHPNLANQWLDNGHFPNFEKLKYLNIFKDIPIFIYHGTKDPALEFKLIKKLAEDLNKTGALVTTSFIPNRGHIYQDANTHKLYGQWLDNIIKQQHKIETTPKVTLERLKERE
ncbi:hypothetical protein A7985_06965 [Pseudoalteromonas luteoviolacea]|uniref:Phospholipase/carboxylesterase/thioesterase domain-containing protein n=1 Tax=Pseudoalteromonas luteoviolacea TaxID=43657 RepID=A0A1C0TWG9_9GAMM|nr:prolyl oligopeptidase family serine peptidase [Pseudoalteromonas luteoviolacea]OCQ23675.1 hypothetical protein A7985_06965 [Pseudoalteromonas luteoviolacea]